MERVLVFMLILFIEETLISVLMKSLTNGTMSKKMEMSKKKEFVKR